jgi:hypothetical protein
MRELVRDFFIDQRFRCDVFTRSARRLAPTEQRRRLLASSYALTRPERAVTYSAATPAGRIVYDNDAARTIVHALASGPRPLAEVARGGVGAADLLANALALCAAGDVRPVEASRAPVAALNRALRRRLGSAEEISVLALPCGTALDIDHSVRGLLSGAVTGIGDRAGEWRDFLAGHGC